MAERKRLYWKHPKGLPVYTADRDQAERWCRRCGERPTQHRLTEDELRRWREEVQRLHDK